MSFSLFDSLTALPSSLRLSEILKPLMYAVLVHVIAFLMAFSILLLYSLVIGL